jgi:5-hydroxyisourate hydrolase
MSAITTHVLDTSTGKPAPGISVVLEQRTHTAGWQRQAEALTDSDGRVNQLLPARHIFGPGHYRLTYDVGPYFLTKEIDSFFPQITVSFVVKDAQQRYHVPLLLSPFGYSTYRGS